MPNTLKVHFSSQTVEWATPQALFDDLDAEFGFETDVCATADNAKCPAFYTTEDDGLRQKWTGVCWMNPPYGRQIGDWVRKAYESAQAGAIVVSLVPARTDTKWWNQYCVHGEIRFLEGRLKFGDGKQSAPFPSAIIIFRPPARSRFRWTTMVATRSPAEHPKTAEADVSAQKIGVGEN
jgi:phage N-6-adenine-methyltransferase